MGQGKNEHIFLPTFQVRPLCIPLFIPNIRTHVLLFRLFSLFFWFVTSVNGSHMNNVGGSGI